MLSINEVVLGVIEATLESTFIMYGYIKPVTYILFNVVASPHPSPLLHTYFFFWRVKNIITGSCNVKCTRKQISAIVRWYCISKLIYKCKGIEDVYLITCIKIYRCKITKKFCDHLLNKKFQKKIWDLVSNVLSPAEYSRLHCKFNLSHRERPRLPVPSPWLSL